MSGRQRFDLGGEGMTGRRNILARLRRLLLLAAGAVALPATARSAHAKGDATLSRQAMIDLFDKHVNAELAGNLDATMATMNDSPHLNHVPTMAGGVGREGVRNFYRDHLVGKFFPPDMKMVPVSRTVGDTGIVDEVAISFTHTTAIDWLLPGVAPTGKPVEMAVAVIVGFKDGKISHEHIYWDQASVLVQVGLLDPKGLPVGGAEVARKVVNPNLPSRRY
jgi:carboxymethylenebutenolidase